MCVSNKIEKILNLCVGKCGLWFEALLVVSKTRKLKDKMPVHLDCFKQESAGFSKIQTA